MKNWKQADHVVELFLGHGLCFVNPPIGSLGSFSTRLFRKLRRCATSTVIQVPLILRYRGRHALGEESPWLLENNELVCCQCDAHGGCTFPIFSVGTVLAIIVLMAVTHILHLTIAVIWASRAVAVAPIVVTLTTIILAGRVIATSTTRWRGTTSAATRRALTTTWTTITTGLTTRVKTPRSRGRSTSPL